MKKGFRIIQSSTGVSPYIWALFAILPFYFIIQWSTTVEMVTGIILSIFFFISYRFAFISKGWVRYCWTSVLIVLSVIMTSFFTYVYFAFFLAYLIGNFQQKSAFITFYIIHLVSTAIAINVNFITPTDLFIQQLPFIVIILISVILMPFSIRSRKRREQLEEQLAFANKRIANLIVQEERQRIARDLHDTLGQKLSLIGLKSDLARKILEKDPEKARSELKDIQQTARMALSEVRKLVSDMRGIRLKEEIKHVKEILEAAGIQWEIEGDFGLSRVPVFIENILSMCLKEAVTNVVKHSHATKCSISINQTNNEIMITITDNGKGFRDNELFEGGNGIAGMKERLEFVNGNLTVNSDQGATVIFQIPNVIKRGGTT
ncbi:sensor histidine kinase [Niallia sp. XMNu-256]|uniref:sensor histidine kinase n=1 Tax=Niallia sp. XMNu-256 TaxID=3082444 RepID=UPI0030D0DFBE